MSTDKKKIRLLIVDLDDTIWTWFDAWHSSFSQLILKITEISGVPEGELKSAIRTIHQRRGTTEYSWLVDELEILKARTPSGSTVAKYFDPALHAQNRARKAETRLYPGVYDTLVSINRVGTPVVAYTESLEFWTRWRMQVTGLDGIIDVLYSSPDHDSPAGIDPKERRTLPADEYSLKSTKHRKVGPGIVKPDVHVLRQIIEDYGVRPAEAVYVGDSVMKDIAMAQRVGVNDVHALYGVKQKDSRYELLREVSHWTDETIAKERDASPGVHPNPRYVLRESFAEVLKFFEFVAINK